MRRILINRARDKGRLKRGGNRRRIYLEQIEVATDVPDESLLDIDDCITRLTAEHPVCATFVKLRFFAGLTINEAAAAVGISTSTAKRQWAFARAWLYDAMRPQAESTNA